jgi:hypothetical protein
VIGRWLGGAVRGLGCLVLLLVGLKFAWHSMFRALWSPPAEPRYYALFTDEGGSVEVHARRGVPVASAVARHAVAACRLLVVAAGQGARAGGAEAGA